MAGRLQGKVAFVTGGGSGIGEATAKRFAAEGATVVICGRRKEPLDAVVAAIAAAGGKAEGVQADVGVEAQIVGAIEDAARRHGKLDILVNNAMAYTWGALADTSTADWHANFTTSVDGTFWGTRTAMKLMQANTQKGGAIVNLSSICGTLGTAWMSGYSAARRRSSISRARPPLRRGAGHPRQRGDPGRGRDPGHRRHAGRREFAQGHRAAHPDGPRRPKR